VIAQGLQERNQNCQRKGFVTALRYLIDAVGSERVALGTDSPFDMRDDDPLARIGSIPGLTARERDDVYGRTALRLLGE